MVSSYVPDKGDIVWVQFSPQSGREQAGRRPALVLSPAVYNRRGLALVCPITSKVKGYSFEVPLPEGGKVTGVVLSDQIKSIDCDARQLEHAGVAPEAVIDEVLGKLGTLLS